jgi:hypothetical protein
MYRRVVFVVSLALESCRSPDRAPSPGPPVTPPVTQADAAAKVAWSFGGCGAAFCVFTEERGVFSFFLEDARDDAGVAPWTLTWVEGSRGTVETTPRSRCFRDAASVVRCEGKEIARGIRSIEGFPYLLRVDGTIAVAPESTRAEQEARERVVRDVPPLERIVATDHGACGLTRSQDTHVWCWSEPLYPFSEDVQKPATRAAKEVPELAGVTDLFLQPWLSLCASTGEGKAFCSAPPPAETAVCVLRGSTDVRCGAETEGQSSEPDLLSPGYDPRLLLERPLVAVPGVEGASRIASYHLTPFHMLVSHRRFYVSEIDEGGCTLESDGQVRCWERDACSRKAPWRSARVEGLPEKRHDLVLGAYDGYAIGEDGVLFRWPRRDVECGTKGCGKPSAPLRIHASPMKLPGRAARISGGTFARARAKGFMGVDCASLESGEVFCWRSEPSSDHTPSVVAFPD